jgi:CRP/FNR family transcriptional regulator, cyclic AMP receptor protein
MAVAETELAAIPLFAGLDGAELEELAEWFDVQTVGAGVKLAGEGATGYSFFVITEGEVAVTSSGREVATLGAGDYFGEMAILGEGRRRATVTSTTTVRLLVMFGTEFRRLQQSYPAIATELESRMAERAAAL